MDLPERAIARALRSVVLVAMVLAGTVSGAVAADPWARVEALTAEQRHREALDVIEELLAEARAEGDSATVTRALIERALATTALHGYETAVRELRAAEWPEPPLDRALLHLFDAQGLVAYRGAQSWQIRQREEVVGELDPLAPDRWSADQLAGQIDAAYAAAWALSDELGATSVHAVKRWVEPGSYPGGIRDTLRELVGYLWVNALRDTSHWRPEHANGVWRLDLERLAGLDPGARVDAAVLVDRAVHPLEKIATVLGDLAGWSSASGRDAAALEAHLEMVRAVHGVGGGGAAKRAEMLQAVLERVLARSRDLPWWAVGRHELAQLLRERGELPRARDVAAAAAERFPESIGGQRCAALVAELEQPSFSMQAMQTDRVGARSVSIEHRNLERLHLRAYRVERGRFFRDLDAGILGLDAEEIEDRISRDSPVAAWSVELPATPDLREHTSYVTPPLTERGAYVLVASPDAGFGAEHNLVLGTLFVVSDLVVIHQPVDEALEVRVVRGADGRPVAGATVALHPVFRNSARPEPVDAAVSGADGRVRFELEGTRGRPFRPSARTADDFTVVANAVSAHVDRPHVTRPRALLWTDRAVYRPGQTVHWKVVVYEGDAGVGRLEVAAGRKVKVELRDTNREVVDEREVLTNAYGSAAGEFVATAGRLLGSWELRASVEGERAAGFAGISVEEYKRPTFEVTVEGPDEPPELNRPVTVTGEARAYHGLPLTGGSARYRVTRAPQVRWGCWWPMPLPPPEQIVAGEVAVGADGRFELPFLPEADPTLADEDELAFRYELAVDVTDEGGETRSASYSVRLGRVGVEAAVTEEPALALAGERLRFELTRRDLSGTPRAGAGRFEIHRLDVPDPVPLPAELPVPLDEGFHTEGDALRPRWSRSMATDEVLRLYPQGERLVRGAVEHGEDGVGAVELGAGLAPGAYRLRYATRDADGDLARVEHDFVVVGGAARPPTPILLGPERPEARVGERLRVAVGGAYAGDPLVLELLHGGRVLERRALTAGVDDGLLELEISPVMRGGLTLHLQAVRDHQHLLAAASIAVPFAEKELALSFTSFRDLLRPGQPETWTVHVEGPDARPAAAELLAFMYDRSLDAIRPHEPPGPRFLFPASDERAPWPGSSTGTVGAYSIFGRGWAPFATVPHIAPPRLVRLDGWGVGGPGQRGRGDVFYMAMASPQGAPAAVRRDQESAADSFEPSTSSSGAPLEEAKGAGEPPPPPELRENFAETAFFLPQLSTDAAGNVDLSFTVPESVTSWKVYVQALTRELAHGTLIRQAETRKELMARPYLPRFLREGDRAELRVEVRNAGEEPLAGDVRLAIRDAGTEELLTQSFLPDAAPLPFALDAGASTTVRFPVIVPAGVRPLSVEVVAATEGLSDGERRPLPVLPSRMRLVQSRFAVLEEGERQRVELTDLVSAHSDPSLEHEQLVLTVEARLVDAMLAALPYLVDYPHECVEQTLNRFVSTALITSLTDRFPRLERLAKEAAKRDTPFVPWDAEDPNRRMLAEETPWLAVSRGSARAEDGPGALRVLDPEVARAQRESAILELRRAQLDSGAFPWFEGGRPSFHMTLVVLEGLARAADRGAEIPEDLASRAFAWLAGEYRQRLAELDEDDLAELGLAEITYLNHVLSSYLRAGMGSAVTPHFDDETRARIADRSFEGRAELAPRSKAQLAVTLARMDRIDDARLVLGTVLDSSVTEPDRGTYWAPEERSWLWYRDTIESHAMILAAVTEVMSDDPRRDGLALWLLLDRKLGHWKSTRATAEALFALVEHAEATGALDAREVVEVAFSDRTERFVFDVADASPARRQVVVRGEEVTPRMGRATATKEGPGYAFASLTWTYSTEQLPEAARGDLLGVERAYFLRRTGDRAKELVPLAGDGTTRIAVGDEVEVALTIRAGHAAEYVHLRDPRGAGFEPLSTTSGHRWDGGVSRYEEVRDSGTSFFFDRLPRGSFTLRYRLRATTAGRFRVAPAVLESLYAPEFAATSAGNELAIEAD